MNDKSIHIIPDMVYIAKFGGASHRFFTKSAAQNWLAWRMINSKPRLECECDSDTGYDCGIHEYLKKLHGRLVRFMRFTEKARTR